jgi:hypothetical protein
MIPKKAKRQFRNPSNQLVYIYWHTRNWFPMRNAFASCNRSCQNLSCAQDEKDMPSVRDDGSNLQTTEWRNEKLAYPEFHIGQICASIAVRILHVVTTMWHLHDRPSVFIDTKVILLSIA